ncbi:helix-turn-helix transcriptional regulator [Phenylobacterium sp.]|uniref:helix-turn-helix domain-containing protein n=1 Tax=Phenylobacterium sp. TaxID=1871053 RepID=UPI00273622B8|nr:helix-turn-helix transcriptional regulator [Phenylobacterium sp.]MDP3661156.1 helix-turn-helix transcriptional regulator [Phenylobacterium sp.]
MAVRIHLDELLLARRMSLAELADRVGIAAADLAILRDGEARALRFSTLDVLCRELQCAPGDLLTWTAEPD